LTDETKLIQSLKRYQIPVSLVQQKEEDAPFGGMREQEK